MKGNFVIEKEIIFELLRWFTFSSLTKFAKLARAVVVRTFFTMVVELWRRKLGG